VSLAFDVELILLLVLVAIMDYICSNFGFDSSSHFPFRAWTHRRSDTTGTDTTDDPTHGSAI